MSPLYMEPCREADYAEAIDVANLQLSETSTVPGALPDDGGAPVGRRLRGVPRGLYGELRARRSGRCGLARN